MKQKNMLRIHKNESTQIILSTKYQTLTYKDVFLTCSQNQFCQKVGRKRVPCNQARERKGMPSKLGPQPWYDVTGHL